MKTPTTLEELSPEWFTRGLRAEGGLDAAAVTAIDVEPIGLDHGFLSTVGRVRLSYDRPEPGAPEAVVVKLEPDVGSMRDFGDELHAFEREIRFYREVAPGAPIRLAKLWFADTGPPDFAMVMEDLTFADPGDQVAGLHARQVQRAAGVMGRLQGRYWGDAALEPLKWMPESNGVSADFGENWGSFVAHFGDLIGDPGRALGDRLRPHIDWLEAEIGSRPRTIVHTDLRADNLMLGAEDTPEEILILDWQIAIRSMGAFDVARLMGGSELPDERHGHQLDVLRAWHESVLEAGDGIDYSWDEAQRDMRLGALSSLCYPVHFHVGVLDATGRSKAVIEAICRRLFDSAVEMDAGRVLP